MIKIATAISLLLVSGGQLFAHYNGHQQQTYGNAKLSQPSPSNGETITSSAMVVKQHIEQTKNNKRKQTTFVYEPNLAPGKYVYIVELSAPSVLQVPQLKRSLMRKQYRSRESQLDSDIKSHEAYLKRYQRDFLASLSISSESVLVTQYEYVLNGVALRLTQAQAMQLAEHELVKKITRETIYHTLTDQGPRLIGAPRLWQGSIGSLQQTQGEGVVVGIIDSGINSDHPSFAQVSADGYVHANPLGDGVYLGDCAGQFPELCNNKLIGVYSYSSITNSYSDTDVFPPNLPRNGEDYDGHGSHVAATAVGNILEDLPETLPTQGEIESDGTPTGFTFEQISGVAPRANLIAYQVCFVGRVEQDDTYAGCPGSAINRGIEDAIKDGVDVINFSISGGGDPWRDATERAFLAAQGLGIFVATSAGNSGPSESSSEKHAPWYTAVAASEHGRQNAFVKQLNNFTGGGTPPASITGQSNTGAITAQIVYAGDFSNPNDPNNDSAQCLQAFPANTFDGQIVVCDRGEIARVDKAINVQAGGAGGYVLANVRGGETFLANDVYVIPGIHINAEDGDRLKTWLASGSNHRATITEGTPSQNIDQARVDVLAGFSSRGPNTRLSILTPTMTAPGVDIYAAFADQRFGHDGHDAPAGDFNYLSGTSMSSPHVAGAAALLKSLHPDWTPDNIRSALAMTATTMLSREDATTPADYFDMGSGRIRVDLAAQSGLLLDESESDYLAAEPAIGGEPRSLNLPSITDNECIAICTWSRTFTATKDGVWDVSGSSTENGLNISVNPAQFSIQAGQTQTIEVTIDTVEADKNRYIFGQVNLTSGSSPDLYLPVSVISSIGNIPTSISGNASRDLDSLLIKDIDAITLDTFLLRPTGLTKATVFEGEVSEDSNNSDYFDDISDGVVITEINVPSDAKRLITKLVSSSAPDLDLYLVFDRNDDGLLSPFEEIGQSQSGNSTEEIQVEYPDSGRYFIVVQSFAASNAATDTFEMHYAVVADTTNDTLQVDAPGSVLSSIPFDMRVNYQLQEANIGDEYYGAIEMSSSNASPNNLGLIAVDISRIEDDIIIDAEPARVAAGDTVSIDVLVAANLTNEARNYAITIPTISGTQFTNIGSGSLNSDGLRYVVNKASGDSTQTTIRFGLNIQEGNAPGPFVISLSSELLNREGDTRQAASPFTQIQIEGPPSITFNGNAMGNFNIFETQSLSIPISVDDPNQDNVTLLFTQTAGPSASVTEFDGAYSLIAPRVEADSILEYDVEANDGNGNSVVSSFSVNVLNNEMPVIESISAPSSATGGQRITITVNVSDPESDNLTVTIGGVVGKSFSTSTPISGNSVSYPISVSDGINTVTDTVTIALTQAPVSTDSGSGGSSSIWYLWMLLALSGLRWTFRHSKL